MLQKLKKLNFKKVISGVKLSLWLMWTWPMPKDATKFKTICMKLYQYLCMIMAISVEASLIYAATNHLDDFAIFVQLVLEGAWITHAICNIIFHKANYHHIQNVAFEMEHFCDLMKPHEETVIKRYIDKCVVFYGASALVFYLTAIAVITIAPTITQQPFPTSAEYPFDVHYGPLRTIIYVYQSMVGIIVSGQLCLNTFVALLLWFASARFEILTEELKTFTDVCQLVKCIKKHQEILMYAMEVIIVARSFALTCICCSTITLIIVGVSILTNQSPIMLIQYGFLSLACLAEVFMFAWPAEHLIFTSNNVGQTVFDTCWYNQSVEVQKLLLIIIARSQKVVTISVPYITPLISFNYLTSYCSTILSYFTTLRVMLNSDKD